MRRSEFVRGLKTSRQTTCRWLAGETFDTYTLAALKELWLDHHSGHVKVWQYARQQDAVILAIADATVEWDDEGETG